MKISDNFTLEEMCVSTSHPNLVEIPAENSTIADNIKQLVLQVLQPTRDKLGRAITVNSGYRPPKLNKAVGGSATSAHLQGYAADVTTTVSNVDIARAVIQSNVIYDQIILEKPKLSKNEIVDCQWVHIGIKANGNRKQILWWDGKTYRPAKLNNEVRFTK